MRLNGLSPFTLLDYPWKIAAIVFTAWCNFRCGFCHNRQFVDPSLLQEQTANIVSEAAFFSFLDRRKGMLDGISICGGEPTIHADLPEFAAKIKEKGFLVKLDTNGTNSAMLQKLVDEKLVDYIAMDVKATPRGYEWLAEVPVNIENIQKSIALIMNSGVDYEFRTTVIAGHHTIEDIEEIAKMIAGAKTYFIQNFRRTEFVLKEFVWDPFPSKELHAFLQKAQSYVQKCEIRN